MRRFAPAALLLAGSVALAALLEGVGLPAGLLIGPMVAAIIFAVRGGTLQLPPVLFEAAMALVGLLIAPSLNLKVLAVAAREPALFAAGTAATLLASALIGWGLARWRVLPGSTAVWGSMPGAATAMVLMARDEGQDWRLVAVMTYLRVLCVAVVASILAALVAGHSGGRAPGAGWFPRPDLVGLAETAVVGAAGAWAGARLRLPAASLLGPMILGAALESAGVVHPQLPGWLLAPAYLMIGWRIGLGFTPSMNAILRRAAPRLAAAILGLIALCGLFGVILSRVSGKDLMTSYLAMSPGGADSVAIIANATPVDVPFVLTMQVLRFVAVLIVGPPLARWVARRLDARR